MVRSDVSPQVWEPCARPYLPAFHNRVKDMRPVTMLHRYGELMHCCYGAPCHHTAPLWWTNALLLWYTLSPYCTAMVNYCTAAMVRPVTILHRYGELMHCCYGAPCHHTAPLWWTNALLLWYTLSPYCTAMVNYCTAAMVRPVTILHRYGEILHCCYDAPCHHTAPLWWTIALLLWCALSPYCTAMVKYCTAAMMRPVTILHRYGEISHLSLCLNV